MTYKNPWLYEGQPFESENIEGHFGFVYRITNKISGKLYIGRKYFWSSRKQPGKKKRVKKESDWKNYYGSSNILKEDVKQLGADNFIREIISLHKTKGETNYNETKLQFKLDVLESLNERGERLYYNNNIMNRYFTPKNLHYKKSKEHKEKIRRTMKENNIHPLNCSLPKSDEHKKKISQTLKETSKFATDNPNIQNIYEIETTQGIKYIPNFHDWCSENNICFENIRKWSKAQNNLQFIGKVKQTKFHKKYNMRILGWKNPKTGRVVKYFDQCSL